MIISHIALAVQKPHISYIFLGSVMYACYSLSYVRRMSGKATIEAYKHGKIASKDVCSVYSLMTSKKSDQASNGGTKEKLKEEDT